MTVPVRSMVPSEHFHTERLAPGVVLRRLHPGGMAGPNGETANDIPGGQTWSEHFALGSPEDDVTMIVPDIRLPPNQLWPLHWHDCWTMVIVLEGRCMIGDWYMEPDDVFVAAPAIEYGPLMIGPKGCRLLEVFDDASLSPGGYSPEYRDHPTLQGGSHVFRPREGVNRRNEGRSRLPVADGDPHMWKSHLAPGWSWCLGAEDSPDRSIVRDIRLEPGERIEARRRGDWHAAQVLGGSVEVAGRTLARDDVVIAERGSGVPAMIAGPDGAHMLEYLRTARALQEA